MTPEEQIRELLKHYHSRCTPDMRKRVAVDIVEKIPGLLELVDEQHTRIQQGIQTQISLEMEKERLQERVGELGSRCTHVDLCPHCGV